MRLGPWFGRTRGEGSEFRVQGSVMNVRRMNRSLWTLTAVLAAAAAACAVLGVVMPVEAPVEDVDLAQRPAATSQASPDSQLPLSAFESIWALDLRKPLTQSAVDAA